MEIAGVESAMRRSVLAIILGSQSFVRKQQFSRRQSTRERAQQSFLLARLHGAWSSFLMTYRPSDATNGNGRAFVTEACRPNLGCANYFCLPAALHLTTLCSEVLVRTHSPDSSGASSGRRPFAPA